MILLDVTDNPNFGHCAACQAHNISETVTRCPSCGYGLGSCSPYFATRTFPQHPNALSTSSLAPFRLPELPSTFSFIDFEVILIPPTGLLLSGDGPVGIETILSTPMNTSVGVLIHSQGRDSSSLVERGLLPCVGDLFVLVDDISISHLSTAEVCSCPFRCPADLPLAHEVY